MKYNRKYKENLIYKASQEDDRLQLIKYCEWEDCNNKGIYKAPRGRGLLRDFHWFCLEHVRIFNDRWDYFANCSQQEIEAELKLDMTWHRPTWPIGVNNISYELENDAYKIFDNHSYDNLNKKKLFDDEKLKILDSYNALGLNKDSSLPEIKRRYKTLVKKHHPDKNHSKKTTSDELIKINEAYSTLIKNLG